MATAVAQRTNLNPAYDIPLRKSRSHEDVRVTPDIAQHWLTYNTSNRNLVTKKVEQFKTDMEAGKWLDDGAPVRFGHGKLLDGQHRLHALILAGATIRMIVVCGLDSEAQVTMDTGRVRTPRDVLSIEGLDVWEAGTLGAALHTILAYESGGLIYSTMKFTNREIRDFYLEHRSGLNSSIQVIKPFPRRHPPISSSMAVAAHYLFGRIDHDLATQFVTSLMLGENLTRGMPLFFLRELLMADAVEKRFRSPYAMWSMLVKAWNGARSNVKWKTKQGLYMQAKEPFPEIK